MSNDQPILSFYNKSRRQLMEPVDPLNYGIFRIAFAVVFLAYLLVYRSPAILELFYLNSDFHFSYSLFHFLHLPDPSSGLIAVLYGTMLIGAGLMALGLFFRYATAACFLSFGYFFLLEKAIYAHHDYLILLFLMLFLVIGPGTFWSLDHRLFGKSKSKLMPYWTLFVFQAQVAIVYAYSALNRINADWLSGRVSEALFAGAGDSFLFVTVVIGLIGDMCLAFMLLLPMFRLLGLVMLVAMNVAIKYYLDMTIFPFLMVSTAALFINPHWIRKIPGPWGKRPQEERTSGGWPLVPTPQWIFLCGYLAIQILVPFRHFIVPGPVQWNMNGERFSWRLLSKLNVGHIDFFVTDVITGDTQEVPRLKGIHAGSYLIMAYQPDMILQYADYLKAEYAKQGIYSPLVSVNSFVSSNGRPFSLFINPELNVAHQDIKTSTMELLNPTGLKIPTTRVLPRSVGQFFSAGYQLAVIDEGELIPGDHPLVIKMEGVLDELIDEEIISPYQVSNLVVEMQEILRVEYGLTYTTLELVQGLQQKYGTMTTVPDIKKVTREFINPPAS